MLEKSMRDRILKDNIIQTALILAWPILLSNVFETVYNLTDAFWLGKLGTEALAAPSITWPITWFLMSISAGFGIAAFSLVSQYTGAGEYEKANCVAGQLLFILVVSSATIMGVGFVFAEGILRVMQIPEGVLEVSVSYLRITFLGAPFLFAGFGIRMILNAVGNTKIPMILFVTSALVDTLLDPFFIFGWLSLPQLGATGAALTTVLTRSAASFVGLYVMFSGKTGVSLTSKHLKPNIALIKRIISLGVPSVIGESGTALGFVLLTTLISLEDAVLGGTGTLLSTYGIGNRIAGLTYIVFFGGASAISTMVGQNLGAQLLDRVKEIVRKLFGLFTGIAILECLIVFILRAPIYRFFIEDAHVIELGAEFFTFFIPSLPFFAIFVLANGVFEAAGQTRVSMALSLMRLLGLRMTLSSLFYFVFNMGVIGIWSGMALSNIGVAVLSILYLLKGNWRHRIIESTR